MGGEKRATDDGGAPTVNGRLERTRLPSRLRGAPREQETKQENVRAWNPIEKNVFHEEEDFASGHRGVTGSRFVPLP